MKRRVDGEGCAVACSTSRDERSRRAVVARDDGPEMLAGEPWAAEHVSRQAARILGEAAMAETRWSITFRNLAAASRGTGGGRTG